MRTSFEAAAPIQCADMADVVIVGAGMAGLSCALDLRDAGADVVLVEASSRPGGRVRTLTFPDGRWVEAGGEWIDTSHDQVHALLARFGLKTIGDGAPWWAREAGWVEDEGGLHPAVDAWAADDRVTAELARFDELIDTVAAGIADPADPAAHPEAAAVDARSIADLFDEADLGETARFLLDREMAFEYTCRPDEASVLFIAQQHAVALADEARVAEVRSQRVEGGLSRLVEAIAGDLGGVLRTDQPLVRLEQDDRSVRVITSAGTVEAAQAVLACPLPSLRDVEVTPAFDGAFGRGIAEVGLGAVVKTFVRASSRPPFVWAVSHRSLQRLYDATEDQPGGSAVLDAYVGGEAARELVRTSPGRTGSRGGGPTRGRGHGAVHGAGPGRRILAGVVPGALHRRVVLGVEPGPGHGLLACAASGARPRAPGRRTRRHRVRLRRRRGGERTTRRRADPRRSVSAAATRSALTPPVA